MLKKIPYSILSACLAVLGVILLSLSGCQLPAFSTGSVPSASINIRVPGVAVSANPAAAGSRFLTAANGSKVGVRISRADSGAVVFSQDVDITAVNGVNQAQVQATGIPVGVALALTAWVDDASGSSFLKAGADFTVQAGADFNLPVSLAPDLTYPGLAVLATDDLVIPAGGVKIFSLPVEAGEQNTRQFLSWATVDAGVVCAALSDTGADLTLASLASGRGIKYNPATSSQIYFLVVNTGASEVNLGAPAQGFLYTMSFNYLDDNATAPLQVELGEGDLVAAPADPVRTGLNFAGWYKDASCTRGNKWDFATATLGADTNLYAKWTGFNQSLGFTLNLSQPGQNITFVSADVTVAADSTLTLAGSDAALSAQTSGWVWYVDGTADTSSTGGTFVFDPAVASYAAGSHVVSVATTQGGASCSGSLRVTVTPVVVDHWSVIYLAGDAESGTPPAASIVTGTTASATVAGSGSLTRLGSDFVGWTLVSASGSYAAGSNFAAGDLLTVTADMVFKPRWTLVSLVDIPGGTFCRDGLTGNNSTVSSFRMGKYAVTQGQYQSVMTGNPNGLSASPSYNAALASRPVEQVSWYAALVFCNRLSIQEGLTPVYSVFGNTNPDAWGTVPALLNDISGLDTGWDAVICDLDANGYRLPTEAEWMWAAMGGMSDKISGNLSGGINAGGYDKDFAGASTTGAAWTPAYYNSNGWANYVAFNSLPESLPVGSRLPNEFGLYDMCGNVFGWLWDWFNFQIPVQWPSNQGFNLSGPSANPTGSRSGIYRLARGGSYFASTLETYLPLGTMGRHGEYPSMGAKDIGFRVARSMPSAGYLPWRGLVNYWSFDGQDNPGDNSSQGDGNNSWATFTPAPAKIANRKGLSVSARYLGTGTTVTAPKAVFGKADAFTVSLWAKPAAYPSGDWHYLVNQQGGTTGQFQYWININASGNLHGFISKNYDGARYEILSPIAVGVWSHVVLSWSPDNPGTSGALKLWMNGTLAGTQAVDVSAMSSLPDSANPKQFMLGGGYSSGTVSDVNYAGGIDDLRMYNRTLSDAEILKLYQE